MLEIKPLSEWANDAQVSDPTERIKGYADYVRTSHFKAGEPLDENALREGMVEKAKADNLISDDEPEVDKEVKLNALFGPKYNADADAKFLLDHYDLDYGLDSPERTEKAATLRRYFALKKVAPERVGEVSDLVDQMVGDRNAVKQARIAAVDRGDYNMVAVDEVNGRQIYTGRDVTSDNVKGKLDSLLSSGAIDSTDLPQVSMLTASENGGLTTVAENSRYRIFANYLDDRIRKDPQLGDKISQNVSDLRRSKQFGAMSTSEQVWDVTKQVGAAPFDAAASAIMSAFGEGKETPKYSSVVPMLAADEALRKKGYTEEDIIRLTNDYLHAKAGPAYRADKPESGIETDSLGNPIISDAILPNKAKFDAALASSTLNEEQKKVAGVQRDALMEVRAPEMLRLILGESSEAVDAYAKARAEGKTVAQFVGDWVSNNEQNYNGMWERSQQFMSSIGSAIATLPVGVAALAGNEAASKALVAMQKDQTDRQEYSRLFGDEYGLTFDIINTIPQVAVDVLATIGTGALYGGMKAAVGGGVRAVTTNAARAAVGLAEAETAAAVAAAAAGKESVSTALRKVGTDLAGKLSTVEQAAPVFATSFLRSASSTYGSVYNQLPSTMSHEEKHRNAFGYAIASGLSTAVITTGMSALGAGGIEDLGTGKIKPLFGEVTEAKGIVPISKLNYRQAKLLYETVKNEGTAVSDQAFQTALRRSMSGAYKNYLSQTLKGSLDEGLEETIDQAFQARIEDAALNKETPLYEKAEQLWNSFAVGGVLGGAHPAVEQLMPLGDDARVAAYSAIPNAYAKIADELRKTGSNATAEIVERRMMDANLAAMEAKKAAIAEQQAKEAAAAPLVADTNEKNLPTDEAPAGVEEGEAAPKAPTAERVYLDDLVGEKVHANGRFGTLERTDGGQILMRFVKPLPSGETSMILGPRFKSAEGLVSKFPTLPVLASDTSGYPAGTPFVLRGKTKFMLPAKPRAGEPDVEVSFTVDRDEETGKVVRLHIFGAPSLTDPENTMDVQLTSPSEIRSVARHYGFDLDGAPEETEVGAATEEALSPEEKALAEQLNNLSPEERSLLTKLNIQRMAASKEPVNLTPEEKAVETKVAEIPVEQQDALVELEKSGKARTPSQEPKGKKAAKSGKTAAPAGNTLALLTLSGIDGGLHQPISDLLALKIGSKAFKEHATSLDLADLAPISYAADSLLEVADSNEGFTPQQKSELRNLREELKSRVSLASQIIAEEITAGDIAETPTVEEEATDEVIDAPVSSADELMEKGRKIINDIRSKNDHPIVTAELEEGSRKLSINQALKVLDTYNQLSDLAEQQGQENEVGVREFHFRIALLQKAISRGRASLAQREKRLKAKLDEITSAIEAPAEGADEQSDYAQYMAEVARVIEETQRKPKPAPVSEKPTKAPKTEPKFQRIKSDGPLVNYSDPQNVELFRTEAEKAAFEDLVSNGFLVTNLTGYGEAMAKIGEGGSEVAGIQVPLFSKKLWFQDDPTDPNEYIRMKHKLLRDRIFALYPPVTPELTGGAPVDSLRSYTDPNTGKRGKLKLPVTRDAGGNIMSGGFTNDPLVTSEQINKDIAVFIPQELIAKSNDPNDGFAINPSIEFDKISGAVIRVVDPVTLGDKSMTVKERSYSPIRGQRIDAMSGKIVTPDSRSLSGAGALADGRRAVAGRSSSYKEYMDGLYNYMWGSPTEERGRSGGMGAGLLSKVFGLDRVGSLDDAASCAMADYEFTLKEYSIANKLLKNVVNGMLFAKGEAGGLTQQAKAIADELGLTMEQVKEDPSVLLGRVKFKVNTSILKDLNPVKTVADSFSDRSKKSVASALVSVYPNLKGGSDEQIIMRYAQNLLKRITEPSAKDFRDSFYKGMPPAESFVRYYGQLFKMAAAKRTETELVSGGAFGENPFAVLDQLMAVGNSGAFSVDPLFGGSTSNFFDDAETINTYNDSLHDSLVASAERPEIKEALRDILVKFDPHLGSLQSAREIVDLLSSCIGNANFDYTNNRDLGFAIVNRLVRGESKEGLKVAAMLAEIGWIPPVRGYAAVAPTLTSVEKLSASLGTNEETWRSIVQAAKEAALESRGETTEEQEAAYRELLLRGVKEAQAEVTAAQAKANEKQVKADIERRSAKELSDIAERIEKMAASTPSDRGNAAIALFDDRIKDLQAELVVVDNKLEGHRKAEAEAETMRAEAIGANMKKPSGHARGVKITKGRAIQTARKGPSSRELTIAPPTATQAVSENAIRMAGENATRARTQIRITTNERAAVEATIAKLQAEREKFVGYTNENLVTTAKVKSFAAQNKADALQKEANSLRQQAKDIAIDAAVRVKTQETSEKVDYRDVAQRAADALARMAEQKKAKEASEKQSRTLVEKSGFALPTRYSYKSNSRTELRTMARGANMEALERIGLESGNRQSVASALRFIAAGKNKGHALIADLLLSQPDFLNSISTFVVDMPTDWAGIYNSESNVILVNLAEHNGRGLEDVLLHEMLHAATVHFLNNPVTAGQRAAVARIEAIRQLAIKEATKAKVMHLAGLEKALSNNAEFLSVALTSPETQAILRSLAPTGQRNILSRIVEAITNLVRRVTGKVTPADLHNAVDTLFDFTKMSLADTHTFNIDAKRDIRNIATDTVRAREDLFRKILIEDSVSKYLDGEGNVYATDAVSASAQQQAGGLPVDPVSVIRNLLPAGMTVELAPEMKGAMSARRSAPDVVRVNPERIAAYVSGLSAKNARSVLQTAVDEELAHHASYTVFSDDDFDALAKELGPEKLDSIAMDYYSNYVSDPAERQALIEEHRANERLRNSDLAAEWVRMEMHRMATGHTNERTVGFLLRNPNLLERFIEGIKAFVAKLRDRVVGNPNTSTYAKISMANRELRRLKNDGVLPRPEAAPNGEYGDTTLFLNALDENIAEGQEDRTSYSLPLVAIGKDDKVKRFWKAVQDKMYNVPVELKRMFDIRNGVLNSVQYDMQWFADRFPKLRDAALAKGVAIEDIGKVLGTTEPMISFAAQGAINQQVRAERMALGDDPDAESKLSKLRNKLEQEEAKRFAEEFRKDQKAKEDMLRRSGNGDLADLLVEFRERINTYKLRIEMGDTNDVYLTRSYRYFTTPAYADAVRSGATFTDEFGNTIDFAKKRAEVAHLMYADEVRKNSRKTMTDEEVASEVIRKLDEYMLDLDKRSEDSKSYNGISSIRKDVNLFKEKNPVNEHLRELLGEVTDPLEVGVRTIYNVARLSANRNFLNGFKDTAIRAGVASMTPQKGFSELYKSGDSDTVGPLAGLYVRDDVAAEIRNQFGPRNRNQADAAMTLIDNIGRYAAKASGVAIMAKTSGSIGFYPRNVLSGFLLTTAQGIPWFSPSAVKASWQANMAFLNDSTEEGRNAIRRLAELQIVRDDTNGRNAMDLLRGFVIGTDEQTDEVMKAIFEAQATGKWDKVKKVLPTSLSTFADVAGQFNNMLDSMFKINAYYYELAKLKENYGATKPEGQLEVMAARKVKLTFPTHSQQLDITKAFNRTPYSMLFLPFLRWKTEVVRTMVNTPLLAYEEMSSGNAGEVRRGVQRMLGYWTTLAFGSAAMASAMVPLFQMLTGDDEDKNDRKLTDEEIAAMREGVPNWQKTHGIHARLVGGKIQMIDLSNINPYSQVTDLFGILNEGVITGKGVDSKRIAAYVADQWGGTQIAATALSEVLNNKDDFGNPIVLQDDNAATAFGKQLYHLGRGAFMPSAVMKLQTAFRAGEKNTSDILLGEFMGVRPNMHEKSEIMRRGLMNIKKGMDEAVALRQPLQSGKKLPVEDIPDIVSSYQDSMNRNQKRLRDFVNFGRSIGMNTASIYSAADQARISKQSVASAEAGYRVPWFPNKEWYRKTWLNINEVKEDDADARFKAVQQTIKDLPDKYLIDGIF